MFPQAPPPEDPDDGRPLDEHGRRKRPTAVLAELVPERLRKTIAVVLALLGVGAVAAALLFGGDDEDHPEEWDERVADLAGYVEDERDLDFDHPVHVDFLTEDEYREVITTDEEDLSDEEREELEQASGVLRALGLAEGELDLFEASNELGEEATLAFYDPATERVRVRGTELTPSLRSTLVHELTHALQDQHFDIGRLGEIEEDAESEMLRALIEGDASRIQTEYEQDELDDDERQEIQEEAESDREDADLEGVPPALIALFAAPYALGEPLVTTVLEVDGQDGLDGAITEPPGSVEPLYDPSVYDADDEPADVDVPDLGDGEEHLDDGDFGAVAWYLVLAQHLEPKEALRAADGWGGDSYVQYEDGATTCVRVAYEGDEPSDVGEMLDALRTWSAAVAGGQACVEELDGGLLFESCDPGTEAEGTGDLPGPEVMALPVTRAQVYADTLDQGATHEQARCFSQRIVEELSLEQLASDPSDPGASGIEQQIQQIAVGCRDA